MNMKSIVFSLAGLACAITLLSQPALANDRFTYSVNGAEVTDTSTGLIWLRCSAGQQFSSDRCIGKATEHNFKGAQAYAKSRATRLNAWRVPTVDELGTLVVPAGRPAAIDNTAFPDTVSNRYWSSTPHDTDATQAMIVLFKDGHIFKYHRNNKAHLRLVRN
jgi:Protein of unknown function (DUF1566)